MVSVLVQPSELFKNFTEILSLGYSSGISLAKCQSHSCSGWPATDATLCSVRVFEEASSSPYHSQYGANSHPTALLQNMCLDLRSFLFW